MSRWFRHYAGMMRDEKLVRAALRAGQPIERVVWIWGAILESAAETDDGGRYELDYAECAYFLRVGEGDIAAIEDALQVLGRVRDGVVGKWRDRQFQSDRSADRQQRYRERHRASQNAHGSDGGQTSRDGGVTSPQRHGDAPETETETETEKVVGGGDAGAREAPITPAACMLAERLHAAMGWERDDPRAIGNAYLAQKWINSGWQPDLCVTTVERVKAASRKTINALTYFEKPIAEAHAELQRPVPVAVVNTTPEQVSVNAATSPLIAAADRLIREFDMPDLPAFLDRSLCGGTSGPVVPLLRAGKSERS